MSTNRLQLGMGNTESTTENNDSLVDQVVRQGYITQRNIERAFRLVDRRNFLPEDYRRFRHLPERVEDEEGGRFWPGVLHLSGIDVYCQVAEYLKLKRGLSFLNVGTGSGFFSTVAGILIGDTGINHGIELYQNLIDYSNGTVRQWIQTTGASSVGFSRPEIRCADIHDPEFLNMHKGTYDRIYISFILHDKEVLCRVIRMLTIGGILVVPMVGSISRYTRLSENQANCERLGHATFLSAIVIDKEERPIAPKFDRVPTLASIVRQHIRRVSRQQSYNPQVARVINQSLKIPVGGAQVVLRNEHIINQEALREERERRRERRNRHREHRIQGNENNMPEINDHEMVVGGRRDGLNPDIGPPRARIPTLDDVVGNFLGRDPAPHLPTQHVQRDLLENHHRTIRQIREMTEQRIRRNGEENRRRLRRGAAERHRRQEVPLAIHEPIDDIIDPSEVLLDHPNGSVYRPRENVARVLIDRANDPDFQEGRQSPTESLETTVALNGSVGDVQDPRDLDEDISTLAGEESSEPTQPTEPTESSGPVVDLTPSTTVEITQRDQRRRQDQYSYRRAEEPEVDTTNDQTVSSSMPSTSADHQKANEYETEVSGIDFPSSLRGLTASERAARLGTSTGYANFYRAPSERLSSRVQNDLTGSSSEATRVTNATDLRTPLLNDEEQQTSPSTEWTGGLPPGLAEAIRITDSQMGTRSPFSMDSPRPRGSRETRLSRTTPRLLANPQHVNEDMFTVLRGSQGFSNGPGSSRPAGSGDYRQEGLLNGEAPRSSSSRASTTTTLESAAEESQATSSPSFDMLPEEELESNRPSTSETPQQRLHRLQDITRRQAVERVRLDAEVDARRAELEQIQAEHEVNRAHFLHRRRQQRLRAAQFPAGLHGMNPENLLLEHLSLVNDDQEFYIVDGQPPIVPRVWRETFSRQPGGRNEELNQQLRIEERIRAAGIDTDEMAALGIGPPRVPVAEERPIDESILIEFTFNNDRPPPNVDGNLSGDEQEIQPNTPWVSNSDWQDIRSHGGFVVHWGPPLSHEEMDRRVASRDEGSAMLQYMDDLAVQFHLEPSEDNIPNLETILRSRRYRDMEIRFANNSFHQQIEHLVLPTFVIRYIRWLEFDICLRP